VARVGRTSLSFKVAAYGARSRTLCFEGEATSVFVDAATMKPRPIPEMYAQRIAAEHRHANEG
jgi:acyl-CoA thioesterase FadM